MFGYELGLLWACDNVLKERQRRVEGEAESGSCVGEREREKKIDFMKVYLDLPETVGGLWNFLRVK